MLQELSVTRQRAPKPDAKADAGAETGPGEEEGDNAKPEEVNGSTKYEDRREGVDDEKDAITNKDVIDFVQQHNSKGAGLGMNQVRQSQPFANCDLNKMYGHDIMCFLSFESLLVEDWASHW